MHYFSDLFDNVLLSSIPTTLADSQQTWHDKYLLRVYSVEIPLMKNSGLFRNM